MFRLMYSIMSISDVKDLSLIEKFQIMEAIWADLREHVDSSPVPQAHKDLLDARRLRVETGEASIRDWDVVKNLIGKT